MAAYFEDDDNNKSSTRLMSFMFMIATISYGFLILYAEAVMKASMPNSMIIFAGLLSGCGGLKLGDAAIKKLSK